MYPLTCGPGTRPRSAAALPVGRADHARPAAYRGARRSRRCVGALDPGLKPRRGAHRARPPPLLRAVLPRRHGRRGGHERRPPAPACLPGLRPRRDLARRGLHGPHPRSAPPGFSRAVRRTHPRRVAAARRAVLTSQTPGIDHQPTRAPDCADLSEGEVEDLVADELEAARGQASSPATDL